MKKPIVAFTLSFFLPGAGLAYLGKWKWGFINLGIVLLIGVAAAFILSDETFERYIRYIAIGCAGGSGGLAQALTTQMNQRKGKTDIAA
jgi:hypothetical protein